MATPRLSVIEPRSLGRASTPAGRQILLSARDLTYRPPGAERPVLDGLSLDIASGEIVDVSGPSGAGKTTLLRALARLLPDGSGTMQLAGVSAEEIPAREWRTRVALLPQVAVLRGGTVHDNLLLPWTLKVRAALDPPSRATLRDALAGVGLADIDLDRDTARLSVGQAARIALLRVSLTRPDLLLLDEPDANLDDESAAQVAGLTRSFAASGGGVARVRHLRRDTDATRVVRMVGGALEEVPL